MSILLNTPSRHHHTTTAQSAAWFALYFVIVILGGALLGGILIRMGLQTDSGFWHDLILEHGPDRILRRFQTLFAVLLAPWLLKKISWQGSSDLGWNSRQSRDARKQDFLRWFVIGLVAMCGIFAVSLRAVSAISTPFLLSYFLPR